MLALVAPIDQGQKVFPRREYYTSDGTRHELGESSNAFITDDIQALEWFARLQDALREADRAYPEPGPEDCLPFYQVVADRMGVPCVMLDDPPVMPRKLAPGAMLPEQVQEKHGLEIVA